jgi:hypothetical protein
MSYFSSITMGNDDIMIGFEDDIVGRFVGIVIMLFKDGNWSDSDE